jgi:CRISPR/Cas system-associated exonuclease Cas4 (RecB family)
MAEYVRGYNPNRSSDWNYGGSKWKLSRSKIDLFIECPRCFYVDNKLGTKRPSIPSFNLNIAVDELLKKEFDTHRLAGTSHPLMLEYKLEAIPYQHADLDVWRDPFIGVTYFHPEHKFIISGGVDDIWVNPAGELIVVDYKATAKEGSITTLADSSWEEQYRRQVGVYQWLLRQNGFNVSDTAYFVYCNGLKTPSEFGNVLTFETTLISCTGTTDWIEPILKDIKGCLEREVYPASGPTCEYCKYREAVGMKLQAIHNTKKK